MADEPSKVSPDDGGQAHWRCIVANFFHRGREVHDGIVFCRHGGVAALALGGDGNIDGNFFGDLHADVLHFAILNDEFCRLHSEQSPRQVCPNI